MTNETMIAKVNELEELKRLREAVETEIDQLTDEIKQHMTDHNLDAFTAGPFSVTWMEVAYNRIDGKALKADHPEIAAKYSRTTYTRRFTVK